MEQRVGRVGVVGQGALEFGKGLWDPEEPELWLRDLTGQIVHWIEVGQPDDRRLAKASSRAEKVTIYSYIASTPIWWAALEGKLIRAPKVAVWSIDPVARSRPSGLNATVGIVF